MVRMIPNTDFPISSGWMKVALPLSVEAQMAQWKGTYGYVENVVRTRKRAESNVLAVTDSRAKHRIYNIAEPTVLSQAVSFEFG